MHSWIIVIWFDFKSRFRWLAIDQMPSLLSMLLEFVLTSTNRRNPVEESGIEADSLRWTDEHVAGVTAIPDLSPHHVSAGLHRWVGRLLWFAASQWPLRSNNNKQIVNRNEKEFLNPINKRYSLQKLNIKTAFGVLYNKLNLH